MSRVVSISEAASIALHAMILVGRSGNGSLNVDQIAEICGSSRHHVAKVMQRLAKEGYVGSFRGPNGGFFLLKKPEEINLLEIYESIEGKITESSCPMEKPVCSFDICFMNNITLELTQRFKEFMQSRTLASYL